MQDYFSVVYWAILAASLLMGLWSDIIARGRYYFCLLAGLSIFVDFFHLVIHFFIRNQEISINTQVAMFFFYQYFN